MSIPSNQKAKPTVDKNLLNILGANTCPMYSGKALATLHSIYISGDIQSPENYTDAFELIRQCGENDIVKIHINSHGGDLFTAVQFMRVLKEAECSIACSVEGACMSAATLIFLAADQFEISDHSAFMFHNYSTRMAGKGGELYDSITFDRKWSEDMLKTEYEGLLTEDEIYSVLNNKDLWFSADEMGERLEGFVELKKKRHEEEQKNSKKDEK
jgi:ATP-dependent protease ClpP protease subunit